MSLHERWCRPRRVAAIVSLVASLAAFVPGAMAQQRILQRPLPGTPPTPATPTTGPPPQQPLRPPMSLTPSIGVAEEFNDNILQDNRRRDWDFITVFTPGLTFTAERPTWRFNVGYDFDSRLYTRNSNLDRGLDRQNFFLDSFYRVDPTLTLSLDDAFTFDTGVNAFSSSGFLASTGRTRSTVNTLRPGVTWQFDRETSVRGFGAWTTEQFSGAGLLDSDTYRLDAAVDRQLTPRLRGTAGYQFADFEFQGRASATAHTPRVGLSYAFTPTLTGSIAGGPTFESQGGTDRVTPAVNAALRQQFPWGQAALTYTREVGTSGALGGTTDNQSMGFSVVVATLTRGLSVDLSPEYRTSESPTGRQVDIRAYTIPLRATYQITPWFAVSGGYAFLHQRSDSTLVNSVTGTPIARDVDQNRVFLGLIFGYPINFD